MLLRFKRANLSPKRLQSLDDYTTIRHKATPCLRLSTECGPSHLYFLADYTASERLAFGCVMLQAVLTPLARASSHPKTPDKSSCYALSTGLLLSYSISRIPSLSTTFTIIYKAWLAIETTMILTGDPHTPLKSIGNLRCSSSVHMRRIFIPCSKLMSEWWCLSSIDKQ